MDALSKALVSSIDTEQGIIKSTFKRQIFEELWLNTFENNYL